MKIIVFRSAEEKARGLQRRPSIEPDTLFVFVDVRPGQVFHSRNVPGPFDIAFLDAKYHLLLIRTLHPPKDTIVAPAGTALAVESAPGLIEAACIPERRGA